MDGACFRRCCLCVHELARGRDRADVSLVEKGPARTCGFFVLLLQRSCSRFRRLRKEKSLGGRCW
eukprot:7995940-Pyramimonas_sp.AAC.1